MGLTYDQRLKAFATWPHRSPSPSEMAAAGFIFIGETMYDNQADAVKCLDCGSILNKPGCEGYIPFTEHAKYKPNCPFVIAQQLSAALKAPSATSMEPPDSTPLDAMRQYYDSLTPQLSPAKLQTPATRDAEEITMLREEVKTLVKQRDLAHIKFTVEQDRRKDDLCLWRAKIESVRTGAADALAGKEVLEAAHAAECHDLNAELRVLRSIVGPFQTAIADKATMEAAHSKDVQELKTEIKALTTSIAPLQTVVEGLAASITRLQADRVTIHHESPSEVNGHDHHAEVMGHTLDKELVEDDSLFSA